MPRQKEEFKTYKDVFDQSTVKNLFKLISQGVIEGLKSPVFIGKEANVFTAETKEKETVIAKIYRIQACDFKKMYGYISTDPRFFGLRQNRIKIVYAWAQREYRNLLKAREANVRVPTPIAVKNNVLVMEMIGEKSPALRVKDDLPENPDEFFKDVVENMHKLHKAKLVHSDLSGFNILNCNEKPVFIDFSQATPSDDPNFEEYLERDITNVCNFFRKIGVKVDKEKVKKAIVS